MANVTKDCDKVIDLIVNHFYRGSTNFNIRPQEITMLTWEKQQILLNATMNNEVVKKYPVNPKFTEMFLKKIIACLETAQDVHDDLYTHLCSVIEKKSNSENYHYRHFIIGNDISDVITSKETNNMVFNGTTGMRTWEAALVLSDWLLCNPQVILNKNILEFGAGVGFTGMTIAKKCYPNSITLTDCHTEVLRTICDNMNINFPDMKRTIHDDKTIFNNANLLLEVMMLDWNHVDRIKSQIIPDILLGADIVYDPELIKPLCNAIKIFVDQNDSLEIYIAIVIRNEDTYKIFMEHIDQINLACENLGPSKSVYFECDSESNISLLHLKKAQIK